MTALLLASLALEASAAVTAVLLAHRRAEHRPAAVALVLLALANVARVPLNAALPYSEAPWEGASRALIYLDGAAVLAAVAVVPGLALAVSVSAERRRVAVAAVAGIWLLASIVLAVLYPAPLVRGASLQRLYLAADLIGLFVSIAALASWVRLRRSPGSAHMIAMALVALDLGILLVPYSPWRDGTWVSPFGRFDIIQIGIVVFFAAFSAAQGVIWRFSPR